MSIRIEQEVENKLLVYVPGQAEYMDLMNRISIRQWDKHHKYWIVPNEQRSIEQLCASFQNRGVNVGLSVSAEASTMFEKILHPDVQEPEINIHERTAQELKIRGYGASTAKMYLGSYSTIYRLCG